MTFPRLPDHQRAYALVERDDGVLYRLYGGVAGPRLPHDIMHLIAERELRIRDGIWAGIPFAVHEYAHDPRHESYGREASEALGVSPDRVFKTLVAEVDGALVTGVVPVEGQLDLKALAAACGGKKAAMAQVTAAERATGYVAGGISPVGQRKRLPVVVDASAMGFATVFCSAGRRGLEIELAPTDLVRAAGATVADISRLPG